MDFEVGKLYKCAERYLVIYPTIKKAMRSKRGSIIFDPDNIVNFWSKRLKCTVCYSKPDEIFLFLEEKNKRDEIFLYALFSDKQGWIRRDDYPGFSTPWIEIVEKVN